jgi:hypothetical protein
MTSDQFVIWFKGFIEACNDFAPTPKQWDSIKDKLDKVSISEGVSLATGVLNISGRTDVTSIPKGTNITYTTKQQLND